jgi:hypothetical protein
MIRKIPLILAVMAASALAGLPIQGAAGAAASGSGAIWQIVPSPNPGTFPTLLAVGASSTSDAWTAGYYANSTNSAYFSLAEHWNGSAWAVVPTPNPFGSENILNAVADLSPANAWAVGYSVDNSNYYNPVYHPLAEHWNGTGWSAVPAATDSNGLADVLSGVAAASATDVWAVGNHFDATIGGYDGLIEHWNGSRWGIVPSPTSTYNLSSVAVISASDVWAAGENSTGGQPVFEHWDGKTWTALSGPPISAAYVSVSGITAVSTSDVWAVGSTRGTARGAPYQTLSEHWNGTAWSIVPSPNPVTGNDVFIQAAAISRGDVWAVGYDYGSTGGASPLVANWDGTKWHVVSTPVPSGTQYNELAAVAALSTGTVWAVGRSDYEDLIIKTSNG